ncbi:hypothetical protein ACC846_37675, partial [Rhizobium ruizarguesonis]
GDFGHRISKDYEDDNLNQFAVNINTLLSIVDAGIGETLRVVASLAEGDLTQTMSGNFLDRMGDALDRAAEMAGADKEAHADADRDADAGDAEHE